MEGIQSTPGTQPGGSSVMGNTEAILPNVYKGALSHGEERVSIVSC